MTSQLNQNPEQLARDRIDAQLRQVGREVQAKNRITLNTSLGVAVREYSTSIGPADYLLFVDGRPAGVIEAKREEIGHSISAVEEQTLGEQAEQEVLSYLPIDDNRKFTELFPAQQLNSAYIASDSAVCISTIQRLYAKLKGDKLDDSAEELNPSEQLTKPKARGRKARVSA